jgi:thiamine-monophosphate kinase
MIEHWSTAPTVADLGEQGVLERILPLLPQGAGVILGPGDDAAVIDWPSPSLVTTCDVLVEGPDFRRDWSSGYDIGWKAMASNLADIAAMGAVPRGVIIALAVPTTTGISAVEDIARGVAEGLGHFAPECGVWGGDLSTSEVITIAVTVIGDLEGRPPVTRSGACPGDIVAVAGRLGDSSRGLEALRAADGHPVGIETLRQRSGDVIAHLRPDPPLSLGVVAAEAGATAMMDLSDGLLIDARRLAKASDVTIDLDPGAFPDHHALVGGEDHGVLACFPNVSTVPDGFVVIGAVGPGANDPGRVTVGGVEPEDDLGGWDPYRFADTK